MNKVKRVIWKIFLAIMILLALYRLTSYSQTSAEGKDLTGTESERNVSKLNFELYQNEPEKFLKVTSIKFDIFNSGNASLIVNDRDGNLIETLVNGDMQPGHYNVYFKAPKDLSPGEYIYKLEVDGTEQTKKMFLLKY